MGERARPRLGYEMPGGMWLCVAGGVDEEGKTKGFLNFG